MGVGWVPVYRDLTRLLSEVGPDAKLVYLFIRANQHGTALPGLAETNALYLAADTQLSPARVKNALRQLDAAKLVEVDQRHNLVLDLKFPLSPAATAEIVRGWWRCWDKFPPCGLRDSIVPTLRAVCRFDRPEVKDEWDATFGTVDAQVALPLAVPGR